MPDENAQTDRKDKKDLEGLSNEQLSRMFAPLPYRETDPMVRRKQVGQLIIVGGVVALLLYLLFS